MAVNADDNGRATQRQQERRPVRDADAAEWVDLIGVPGLPDGYCVSTTGWVRIPSRTVRLVDGRVRKYSGLTTKGWANRKGYRLVNVRINGIRKSVYIHFLVAWAFHGPKPDGRNVEVNHKNGVKGDNHYENLEWVPHQENAIHSIRTGLRKKFVIPSTKNTGRIKDRHKKVIRFLFKEGRSVGDIAIEYGISKTYVRDIIRGRR